MAFNSCVAVTTPAPLAMTIPASQWSGSGSDYYVTVNASNITADSILIPHYDESSAAYLNGLIWCVPAAGSFTIHTSAIPSGAVTVLIQFAGTNGDAQYQVLADVYSTSQALAKADVVDELTSTATNAPLSANQGKILDEGKVNYSDIVNNLTSTATDAPLSAAQGKELGDNKSFQFLLAASGSTSTWADMYNKLKSLDTFETATFFASGGAASLLTGGAVTSTMKGIAASNGSGVYDFFAFAGLGPNAYGWRVTNLTSSSSTGTVGMVYRYDGMASNSGSVSVSSLAYNNFQEFSLTFTNSQSNTNYMIAAEPSVAGLVTSVKDKTTAGCTLVVGNLRNTALTGTVRWKLLAY